MVTYQKMNLRKNLIVKYHINKVVFTLYIKHQNVFVALPVTLLIVYLYNIDCFLKICFLKIHEYVHVSEGAHRSQRHWMPRSWSYRWLQATLRECWKPNLGPL